MTGLEKAIKIDVVCVPFSGHLLPTLTLLEPLLADRRFQIRVITGCQKKELVETIGFDCLALFPERPTVMEDIANTPQKLNLLTAYRQFRANADLIPQVMDELHRIWQKDGRPDLVIADFVATPAGLVADRLGLPWITTIPSPVALECRWTTPTYLGGWRPHEGRLYKIRDALGRKAIHLGKRLAFSLIRRSLGDVQDFKLYRPDGTEAIYSPYSILALWLEELEFRDDFPEQLRWVGYRCLSFDRLPQEQQTYFAADGKKKVLVTCGTHLLWEKERMVGWSQKLSQHYPDYQFYVTLGQAGGLGNPPQKLAANLLVFDYLPYSDILEQMDFVIHHAGTGIMLSCIELGIPSLILPQDYDQFDNAVRAEIGQAGLVVRRQTDTEVLRLFQELTERTDWPQLQDLAQKSRAYEPAKLLYQELSRLLQLDL
ncbi:glycosyltransferase [Streptococcus panodentis]|uniref:Glycosyl transferase n=1 Tax=Streptococcus panodentis TaxID=1581472 RepID=A0ABS5AYD6_9STRE|nr:MULTISPECIES: nucleotide disphospho-sugar-binding domain-containing protein [Streptococcus]KXT78026.1 hypothetical protein STRDD11_02480 [Streptococcus sp. DD11]MBP2621593.1 glycosyl transferase [Streptococcus panodentis]